MSSLLILLPLFAQVGTSSGIGTIGTPYASELPLEIIEKKEAEERKRRAERAQNVVLPPADARSAGCMNAVESDPERSVQVARDALTDAIGRQRVRAGLCLGVALSNLGRWDEARTAFVNARDAADLPDHLSKARLGAMAGNAALAEGQPEQALQLLSPAAQEARTASANDLVASIALDRARALVALKRPGEAAQALAEARTVEPENAQAWLLSATLSRRQDKLAEARTQIDKATNLAPQDAEIALEAGVIAKLSGDEAGARDRWGRVVATSQDQDLVHTARQYLAEIGADSGLSGAGPNTADKQVSR